MRRCVTVTVVVLGLLVWSGGCGSHAPERPATQPTTRAPPLDPNAPIATLRVGLVPFVPRLERFQRVIREAWHELQPRVALDFVSWDGGREEDPGAAKLDVFVFDAAFLDDLRAKGRLRPLQAADLAPLSDFVPYATRGLLLDHAYSGIPWLGSTPLLIFRRGDDELSEATTLSQLVNAVGTCVYTGAVPPDARGLLLGLANDAESARLYVGASQASTGQWPIPLPLRPDQLDVNALESLQTLLQASSFYNSTLDPEDRYQRARWFAQGFGRALAAPPDALWALGPALADVDFAILPLGDAPTVRRVFDAQIVGIAPRGMHPEWALQLGQLIASSEVVRAILAPSDGQPAQYLMPVRRSVYRALGKDDPLYRKLQAVMERAQPYLLNLGPRAREWLAQMPAEVQRRVLRNYPCACDQPVAPIRTQSDASAKCLAVCERHDGWTGQWRAPHGQPSVCACRSCPGVPSGP